MAPNIHTPLPLPDHVLRRSSRWTRMARVPHCRTVSARHASSISFFPPFSPCFPLLPLDAALNYIIFVNKIIILTEGRFMMLPAVSYTHLTLPTSVYV